MYVISLQALVSLTPSHGFVPFVQVLPSMQQVPQIKMGLSRYVRTGSDASNYLAGGSFGVVRLAIDTLTQQLVAIKAQRLPDDAVDRELLVHLSLLSHPHTNVIRMLDHFLEEREGLPPKLHMVMPLCDSNLGKVELPTPQAQCFTEGLVAGVAHLHHLCIVHGDLSLANCLIDRDGTVRVADFGAAHSALGVLVPEERTTTYVRAPERWLGCSHDEAPVDVWAVGVIVLCLSKGFPG